MTTTSRDTTASAMGVSYQRVLAWAGPVCAVIWVVGLLVFARFIPPPSPRDGAEQIAHFFDEHAVGIRVGMVLLLVGGVLYQPWVAVITVQMKRIEGSQSPLAYVQLGLGTLFVLLFVLAAIFWQTAAFRPLDDMVLTQRLNDMGWFMFLISVPIVTGQGVALSLAVFQDSTQTLFKRWFGWFNLWAQLVFLPGTFIPLFKTGPMAWNGSVSFWIPAAVFSIWMCVLTWALLRAVNAPDPEAVKPERDDWRDGCMTSGAQPFRTAGG